MSKRRRNNAVEITESTEDKAEVVTFRTFLHDCMAKGLVYKWQEREIHAFFKDLGLSDKEPVDLYKEALVKY